MDNILKSVEILNNIDNLKIFKEDKNIFEYSGRPCDTINTSKVTDYIFLDNHVCDCANEPNKEVEELLSKTI